MKIIEDIIFAIGLGVIASFIALLISYVCLKIKQILKRQSKIRCLCKHEYDFDWSYEYDCGCEEHHYTCKKCGKVLEIKVIKRDRWHV